MNINKINVNTKLNPIDVCYPTTLYDGLTETGLIYDSDLLIHTLHVNYITTDYIHLNKDEQIFSLSHYWYSQGYGRAIYHYDINKENCYPVPVNDIVIVSYHPSITISYIAPDECYVRVCIENKNYPAMTDRFWYIYYGKPESINSKIVLFEKKLEELEPLPSVLSVWKDKKVGFMGDSMTAATSYVSKYASMTGCIATNYAVSGEAIAGTNSNCVCHRINQLASDLDMVVVAGGLNDHRSAIVLGDFQYYNLDGSLDNTFYGALHTLARGLKEKYPTKPIVFMTPIHNSYRDDHHGDTGDYNYELFQLGILKENKFPLRDKVHYDESIARGGTLTEYVDAIKKVCQFYAIPIIDMYSISTFLPILDSNKQIYVPDGIHPTSAAGSLRIADIIYNFLENVYY